MSTNITVPAQTDAAHASTMMDYPLLNRRLSWSVRRWPGVPVLQS
jgi:hypothetical protein